MGADDGIKVAVATGDGQCSNLHFGEITEVLVYALHSDGEASLIEKRAFPDKSLFPASEGCGCQAKNEAFLSEVSKTLQGCRYLLVEKIGNYPARVLLRNGIEVLEQEGEIRQLLSVLCGYVNRRTVSLQ